MTAVLRDRLSVSDKNIIAEINRLQEELNEKSEIIYNLKSQLLEHHVTELIKEAEEIKNYKLIMNSFDNLDFIEVRELASQLISVEGRIVIFGQQDGETTRMILARSKDISMLNLNPVIQEVMPLLDGNGGGQPGFVQGGGSNPDKLPEALRWAREIILKSI